LRDINWQFVIDEHGSVVWKRAYRLLGNDADAQDCFQETFLSMLKVSNKQRVRNTRALLLRLVTLRAIDILRKRTNQPITKNGKIEMDQYSNKNPGPPQQVQKRELAAILRNALGKIPEKEARVFSLRHFNDMSYRQIAKQLNMKKKTVGVVLYRAREKIRNNLQTNYK